MNRWTAAEDDRLSFWWGSVSAATIGKRLGRTPGAVISRGCKVLKLGPPRRGWLSMVDIERRSGFSRKQIIRAAKRARVQLRRQPDYHGNMRRVSKKWKNYAISHEAAERIIAELLKRPSVRHHESMRGEWGGPRKPDTCRDCETTDRPHCARGLCTNCYERRRRGKRRKGQPRFGRWRPRVSD